MLVTGAAGFVGSRVTRVLLGRGYAVHGVVRDGAGPRLAGVSGVRLEPCDLANAGAVAELVARVAPELCVHCAWIATGAYLTSPENAVHVQSAETLGQLLVTHGCRRIVALGTCFEYAPSEAPLAETSALGPTTPYASAKLAAHERLERACAGTATSLAWARLFYLYGPGEDPRRLVPAVTCALLDGRPAPTTAGEQLRDFLHVDDVARALVAILESDLSGLVNVASGTAVTVRELVLTIGRLTGCPELLDLGAIPYGAGDPMAVVADVQRLTGTGFAPRRTLDEGLAETVGWWTEELARR